MKTKDTNTTNTKPPASNKLAEPKPRVGQPTKYNPARADTMIRALSAGLTHAQSCAATGIARETLRSWCEKYPEFKERYETARELARRDALESIRKAGRAGDWKATDRWLIRAFGEDYRPTDRHHTTISSQNTLVICSEEERKQIQAMRQKLLGRSAHAELLTDDERPSNHEPDDPRITDAEFVEEEREERES